MGSKQYGKDYLFLFSWTLTGTGAGLQDIGVLSSLCRPWLPNHLQDMKDKRSKKANIVYLDYIDPYVCSAIIRVNNH